MGPGSRLDAPPVLKDIFRSVEVKVASRDDFSSAGQLNRKGCVIALLLGSNIKHDLGNKEINSMLEIQSISTLTKFERRSFQKCEWHSNQHSQNLSETRDFCSIFFRYLDKF